MALLSTIVAFLACVALVPTTVTLTGAQTREVPANWQVIDQPTATEITLEKSEGGILVVTPQLEAPEAFDASLIESNDGFTFDPQSKSFRSNELAARLIVSGVFADFAWLIDPASTATDVRTTRSGSAIQNLTAPLPPTVALPSPQADLTHTSSYGFRSVAIPAGTGATDITAHVPGRSIVVDPATTAVKAGQLFWPSVRTVLAGWLSFLTGFALLWFFWAIGRALDPAPTRSAAAQMIRAGLGLGLVAAVTSSLSYILPVSTAAWIVMILALTALAFGWRRGHFRGATQDVPVLVKLSGWSLIPAVVLFLPMLFWGGWFAGQYKTDLFFYGSITSLVEDASLTQMLSLPAAQQWTPRVGFDYRSIDGVLGALLTSLSPVTTIVALSIVALTLFLVFAASIIALSSTISVGRTSRVIAVLALLNPVFVGLFVEDYYSHYWFVALIPVFVLGVHAMWQSDPTTGVSRTYALWSTAAVSAVLLAVYPFFFVIAAAAVMAVALLRRPWRAQWWPLVWRLGWRTLLVINVSLLSLTGFFKIEGGSAERLDEIARYVLLSPYTPSQVIGLVAGVVPFHWRFPEVPADAGMGFPGELIWSSAPAAWSIGLIDVALLVLLVLVTLLLVDWKASWRSLASMTALAIPAAFVAFGAYLLLGSREYPALKAIWTAAALFAVVMAGMRWREKGRWVAVLVLAALGVFWVRSALIDRVFWFVNPASDAVAVAHTAVVPDLMQIRSLIQQQPGGVAIAYSTEQPLTGTDQNRVVEAQSQILTRDLGRELQPTFGALTPAFCSSVAPGTGTIVIAGVTGEQTLCGKTLRYRGEVTEVFQ